MEFVGKMVKKEFQGLGVLSGVVNSYDPSTGFFEILYEDGDSEELELSEVASLFDGVGVVPGMGTGSMISNQSAVGASEFGPAKEPQVCQKPKKRRRLLADSGHSRINACIDLNWDVDDEFVDNSKEGDLSNLGAETQKRKCSFDLNMVFNKEGNSSDFDREGQVKQNTSVHVIEETQKQEIDGGVEESQMLGDKTATPGQEESEEYSVLPAKLPLPPSSENLNLDGIPILDLFSVYACLKSFSTLLFLSPFELEDFVAALRCEAPNLLLAFIHVSLLQTLRKHLELLSAENSVSASNCLRNLNWDFLDEITWPIFMVEYLLIHGPALRPGFDLCKLNVIDSGYYKQPAPVKIEILRCLCNDVIEMQAIRSELDRRTRAIELNMDTDWSIKIESSKRRRTSVDISCGSCFTKEVVKGTTDWNSDVCCLCKMDGSLICCDGCPAAYHFRCVGVSRNLIPEGDWYCPECAIDRDKPWLKLGKSIRGADLLGIDPHGRLYHSCCGYLLVSDSCEDEPSYRCYHRNDLSIVIETLKSANTFYHSIVGAILKQWNISVYPNGADGSNRSSGTLNGSEIQGKILSVGDCPLTSTSFDSLQGKNIHSAEGGHILFTSDTRKDDTSRRQLETSYMNFYSHAQTVSWVAEELAGKSSEKINESSRKSVENIILTQMKAISKKSTNFLWPNIQKLNPDARKEKCGWCFSCKSPDYERDCLFNLSAPTYFTNKVLGLCSKWKKKGHLADVVGYIVSIEHRLHGLLSGPWLNPHHSKLWRNGVVKASDITSLKHFLLMLESNLRPLALSAEWVKPVDSVSTMGSACHSLPSSLSGSSRHGMGRKRARYLDLEANQSSNSARGLGLFWWRGGRLSRELFNWKVLPRSLALKAARQGGCIKMLGISYPIASEYARRSHNIAWRAAVEHSKSVEQLALLVRELDANIRWDDIENTNVLSKLVQFRKSVRPFKNVRIRQKCIEGTVLKYLLDFGKRRMIPDVVVTHGSMVEESSSGRKEYWLEESLVPLHLLKAFEEKRIAYTSNKVSSGKLNGSGRLTKKISKKGGFEYLFSKAETFKYYQCAHCKKDVLIREAVNCQYCKGFFHERHVRKSAGPILAECTSICHKCHIGNSAKVETKKRMAPHPRISKKSGKDTKTSLKQKSKKDTIALPPQCSPRKIECVDLQNKKPGGLKKGERKQIKSLKVILKKPKEGIWQKKRTPVYHAYWLNGLFLSRKPNDEQVMYFRSRNFVAPSEQLTDIVDQPKCGLCGELEFASTLGYVGCEICGEWYHGDAFGLSTENISNLIGFRCHKCRNRASPSCPHLHRRTNDEERVGTSGGMSMADSAGDASNVIALQSFDDKEAKVPSSQREKMRRKIRVPRRYLD